MKKSKILVVLILTVLAVISFVDIYANTAGTGITTGFPTAVTNGITNVGNGAKKVWKTVIDIVQMVAFGAIMFAGIRYMLASADQKADIKKGLAVLVLGAILVFAASSVIKFVRNAGKTVMTNTQWTDMNN